MVKVRFIRVDDDVVRVFEKELLTTPKTARVQKTYLEDMINHYLNTKSAYRIVVTEEA